MAFTLLSHRPSICSHLLRVQRVSSVRQYGSRRGHLQIRLPHLASESGSSPKMTMGDGRSAETTTAAQYNTYSREQLLERIRILEGQGESSNASTSKPQQHKAKRKDARPFNIKRYPCRKIALRFAYDGEAFSGLEMQSIVGSMDGTPIETVESALWKALSDARMVDEGQSLQDVGWSRCGRTDRGVSAAGQVVALWIRSRRVDEWPQRRALERVTEEENKARAKTTATATEGANDREEDEEVPSDRRNWRDRTEEQVRTYVEQEHQQSLADSSFVDASRPSDWISGDPNAEELPYVMLLNRLLPPTIQVQAWSPVSPAFNARFDCRYRHYKYFFTSGAPFVGEQGTTIHGPQPPLDIDAMRQAAQRFLGEHDFRNFCKVDPSKQIDNFYRRIDGISIDPVSSAWDESEASPSAAPVSKNGEQMFVLNLRGTAFLYHQVRHIIAVLFLVGARLEKPSIIDELLNVRPQGVHTDRYVMARLHGLRLDTEGSTIETALPPPRLEPASQNGEDSPDLVKQYQQFRQQAQQDAVDASDKLNDLRDLFVYDRKPVYEMALDRPLMLWECGFRTSDIAWRAGSYDGPMDTSDIHEQGASQDDINAPTSVNRAIMHSIWSAQSITAELYRHFTLALPSNAETDDKVGYLPASTAFNSASFPTLQSKLLDVQVSPLHRKQDEDRRRSAARQLIPLGYGRFKTMLDYLPLRKVARQTTPEEKNVKWMATKGQRRKDAKMQQQKE